MYPIAYGDTVLFFGEALSGKSSLALNLIINQSKINKLFSKGYIEISLISIINPIFSKIIFIVSMCQ